MIDVSDERMLAVRTVAVRTLASASLILSASGALHAQMPGLPVLQNGFSNAGITIAGNYGQSSRVVGYGAAVAWAPASGRLQLSAGAGAATPDGAAGATTYGARVAMSLGSSVGAGRFGLAPFAGVGGATFDGSRVLHIPIGIGGGFRTRLGASRGVAIFATPFYSWTRVTASDADPVQAGLLRVSIGVDVALLSKVGATLGLETGQKAKDGDPGATGSTFGAGLSYAFR